MDWWLILIIVLAVAVVISALGMIVFAYYVTVKYLTRRSFSKNYLRRKKHIIKDSGFRNFMRKSVENFSSVVNENMEIITSDGLKLKGFLYRTEQPSDKSVICVHGYRGNGIKDMSFIAPFFLSHGYNVLLVDNRAHGASEGNIIGMGVLDRYDILKWTDALLEKTSSRVIFLYGISMGAATVLMSASLGLPPEVKGIIADCGFTSPWEQFRYLFRHKAHIPPALVLPFVRRFALKIAGYDIKGADTREVLADSPLPVLLIHGKKDAFVPPYMSEQNNEVCNSHHELYLVEAAGHAKSYYTAPKEYEKCLLDFTNKCI